MKKKDKFGNDDAVFEVVEVETNAQKLDSEETDSAPESNDSEQEVLQEENIEESLEKADSNDFEEEVSLDTAQEQRKPLDEIVKPTELDNIDVSVVFDDGDTEKISEIDLLEEDSLDDFLLDSFSQKEPEKKNKFSRWWKARKTWQKALMISTLSFVLVFSILFAIAMTAFDYNYNSISSDPVDLGFEEVIEENIVNIALFGLDTRTLKSFKGNSDSIMILSLNTKTKKVKIISVMRDTLVPITYDGNTTYAKINSAYAKGGPELAVKTLNTLFGLDISEYATVNFFGMVDIIDAVGGIEAELTQGEVTKNTRIKAINFCINELCKKLKLDAADYRIYTPGKQTLNGVQAVAYSRIRYVQNIWGTNNDYGRTDRQRYVMEQLFNKAITLDKSKYISLAKSLIPCSETSLSYSEIIELAFGILLESPQFEQTRMPQEEFLMPSPAGRFGSVVYYDLDFAKTLIHEFIYNDIAPEKYIEVNGIRKYDWYANRYANNGSLAPSSDSDTVVVQPDVNTNNGYASSDNNTVYGDTQNNNGVASTTPETTVPSVSSEITTVPPVTSEITSSGEQQIDTSSANSGVTSSDTQSNNSELSSENNSESNSVNNSSADSEITSSNDKNEFNSGTASNTSSATQSNPDTSELNSAPAESSPSDLQSSEPTVSSNTSEVTPPQDTSSDNVSSQIPGNDEANSTPTAQE